MSQDVKGARRYNSSGRQEQARQTRAKVLRVAHELFLRDGYAATTMPKVADAADVSVETIYKSFGTKAGLAKALFDVAVVGDDEPIPLMEREFVRRNIAEPDPRRKLRDYGTHIAAVGPRASPLLLVVREAAATDPGAKAVWEQTEKERLTGMTGFAKHLAESGHLREDVSVERARDILWTMNSPELFDLLVQKRGWSPKRYGAFVGEQLIAALLPPT